jgi:O-succinylbenzoic acid--CoA ligase
VRATYGLTEACSQVTTQAEGDAQAGRRDAGRPLSTVELAIVDERGERCAEGEVGRVLLRGPTLFSGYHGQPRRAPGEWFDTGDFGALDAEGALQIASRRTDLIVTGGENVYPLEVERRIEGVEGVREALVFGVSDERWGQVVAAALVVDDRWNPEAFARACESRLAPHKRPRRVALVDALPLTPAGKLDRRGAPARFGPTLAPLAYPARPR